MLKVKYRLLTTNALKLLILNCIFDIVIVVSSYRLMEIGFLVGAILLREKENIFYSG